MEINQIIENACNKYEQDQYAMYLRKSRADIELEALGEGETLARHKKMLDALAAKHNIIPDQITVYREVVSGESIDDRPEMQRLLTDVHKRKYKGVLVVEVERLARGNTKDQGEVAEAFQVSDTKIITPAKVYDPDNEFDQEYFEFGLFMSRREYKTIRRRLETGKLQSFMDGNYLPSHSIFGYSIARLSKKDRILVEKPEESKIVHLIFDWFLDGWSTWKIANELTKMGIRTPKGNIDWNRGSVRDMLCNQHYTGKVVWNKQKTVKEFDPRSGRMVKRRKYNPPEEWLIVEGKHKPIIDQDKFDKVQEMLQVKAPVNTDKKLYSPIAGLIKCKDCGKHMVLLRYNDGSRTSRYVHAGNSRCQKKSLAYDVVINAIIDGLKAYIDDYEVKMANGNDQTELKRHQAAVEAMETELAKTEKRKQRLFDSWEADDGTYTREEFIERKQIYTKTIDAIKKQIQEAKAAMPKPVDYSERITTLHQIIACIKDESIDAEEKNFFLKQFIDYIDYDVIDLGRNKGGKPMFDVYLK